MAGPLNFTGQNIEDTYQRIVQVSGSGFCDGTGSAVTIGSTQIRLNSDAVSNTNYELVFGELPLGGGNSELTADGNPSTGNRLTFNPSTKTLTTSNLEVKTNILTPNITASGNISASGDITATKYTVAQNSFVDGLRFTRSGHDSYRMTLGDSEGLQIYNETNGVKELRFDGAGNASFAGNITASGNISASGTIHAGLSTGTSNTVVISDNGELKTDNVDSKIFGNNLVDYTATLSPVTPASRQLAIWSSAGTIRGYDGLTASPNGVITATAISASLNAANISYIGFLDVSKLRINGVLVGQYISNNTVLGNPADTKTIIESPKLEVTDLDVLGDISGTIDGGKF